MNGLNSIPGNGQKKEEMADNFNIKVTHGLNEYQVAVPSNSSFGDLKSIIIQKIGLKPETHKLLFRGKEKDDHEDLQIAGVKDSSKVLLVEGTACNQRSPEIKETSVIARGVAAVAEVSEEVDKLSEKVSALQAAADSGTKVDNKDIVYVTEMLMRQLLKLDGIEAEGEGKVQRKMEVRRIQSFVETMDVLKSRNLNPFTSADSNVPDITQWETFEPDWGSATITSLVQSSHPNPQQSSTPNPTFTPTPTLTSSAPMAAPSSTPTHAPSSISTQMSSSTPNQEQFLAPSMLASIPSPALSSAPVHSPSSTPIPVQFFAPMSSSTKVTEEWVQFD